MGNWLYITRAFNSDAALPFRRRPPRPQRTLSTRCQGFSRDRKICHWFRSLETAMGYGDAYKHFVVEARGATGCNEFERRIQRDDGDSKYTEPVIRITKRWTGELGWMVLRA